MTCGSPRSLLCKSQLARDDACVRKSRGGLKRSGMSRRAVGRANGCCCEHGWRGAWRCGRPLDVLVECEGEDSDGDLWDVGGILGQRYISLEGPTRTRLESSKTSCLGRAVRGRPVGGRRGETRRDRGRRERERAHARGALGYEIGREGHLCNPAALEPQPWVD